MVCYFCGADAGKQDFCPNCGADLGILVKVEHISNAYYNDGLMKADVRNLSGAVISLKKCLKFNKYHIQARNLLGLVYFEMGEAVDAISEWVISKSYQPVDNLASRYLEEIQQNQTSLASINQTIKKYNQALLYCRQDSRDLAKIQLKKVLTMNPKLVKGHQLLALLYIQEEKYEQAKKTLRNAGKIDTDNTTTLRYLREVNLKLREKNSSKKQKKEPDDLISYQSGNETIIMPKRFRESNIGSTLLYVLLGLIVGLAVTQFLLVPNAKLKVQKEAREQLLAANDTISTNNNQIQDLEDKVAGLQEQLDTVSNTSSQTGEQLAVYEQLLKAYAAFINADLPGAKAILEGVGAESLEGDAAAVYTNLSTQVNEQYLAGLYQAGFAAYNQADYETAVTNLLPVVEADIAYEEGNAVYYLAQSYRRGGNQEAAVPYYQYIIENYPGSERANVARQFVPNE